MSKIYCVYMAYAKYEVMDSDMEGYDELPTYPRDCAGVRVYNNPGAQFDAYANTPCPASQLFEADSEEEIKQKTEEFKNNFENKEWLEKNIYPFI